jgi:hypothetical protein
VPERDDGRFSLPDRRANTETREDDVFGAAQVT